MQEAISYLLLILLAFQAVVPNASAEGSRATAAARKCKKAPPSANRKCGVKGGKKTGFYYEAAAEPARVSSAIECGYLCARRALTKTDGRTSGACGSFVYDSQFGSCQIYRQTVSYLLNPKYNGRPREFFDVGCYDCGDLFCKTPQGQPYGTQLLDNGGFEDDFLGPWQAGEVAIVHNPHTKNIHVRGGYLIQYNNFCDLEYYEASFDYKHKVDPDYGGQLFYPSSEFRFGYYEELSYGMGIGMSSDTIGQWKRGRFLFQANITDTPSAGSGFSYLSIRADHGMSVDNVTIVRRAFGFTPVPGAVSVIPNGGFESGKAAPWRIGNEFSDIRLNNSAVSSPGLDGSKYAARYEFSSGGNDIIFFNKNITTKPQTWYMMSARIKNASKKPSRLQYVSQVFYLESDGVQQKKYFADSIIVDGINSWPFFVQGNLTSIAINYYGRDTTIIIDKINLVEVEA